MATRGYTLKHTTSTKRSADFWKRIYRNRGQKVRVTKAGRYHNVWVK